MFVYVRLITRKRYSRILYVLYFRMNKIISIKLSLAAIRNLLLISEFPLCDNISYFTALISCCIFKNDRWFELESTSYLLPGYFARNRFTRSQLYCHLISRSSLISSSFVQILTCWGVLLRELYQSLPLSCALRNPHSREWVYSIGC